MICTDGLILGALLHVLKYFWKYDINMTSIESKPAKETKNVDFTVNFDGRPGDEVIDKLLSDLNRHCTNLLVLSDKTGTYVRASMYNNRQGLIQCHGFLVIFRIWTNPSEKRWMQEMHWNRIILGFKIPRIVNVGMY